MKYHPHLSFPGYGWLEPFSDADMPLIEEEFARDIIAAFDAQNTQILILTDALSDLLNDLEERAKWNLEASQRVVACGNGVYVRAKAALEESK